MIIAISGTPGTGKTEVARLLAERLGFRLLDLNKLAESKDLYAGYDEKRDCRVVDVDRVAEEIKKIKEDVVIESHYAHDIPCDFAVMLRTNPGELRERLKKKGWKREKIEENVLSEIMEVCLTEALELGRKVIEIDTTGKNPEAVVKEIMKKINIHGAAGRNS